MKKYIYIVECLLMVLLIVSCKNINKQEIQVSSDVELLKNNIQIPFQVDSVFWSIIKYDYGMELADYTLLAVIYPSDLDNAKSQIKKFQVKGFQSVKGRGYKKERFQEWYVKKADNKILTTENYYQIKGNIYKGDLFYKNSFIHGICFEHENKIFIMLHTT